MKRIDRATLWDFTVEGRGEFPMDMLRFDECWPQTGDDAAIMVASHYDLVGHGAWVKRRRRIKLRSIKEPTPDRWSSFGWIVIREEHS